mgnify:CR=1 FL=1
MFCTNCGREAQDGQKFCTNCGELVGAERVLRGEVVMQATDAADQITEIAKGAGHTDLRTPGPTIALLWTYLDLTDSVVRLRRSLRPAGSPARMPLESGAPATSAAAAGCSSPPRTRTPPAAPLPGSTTTAGG